MNVVSRLLASVALTGLIAGCTSATGEQVPSTNGIGPITFAIGSDDIAWLTPVIAKWNEENPGQQVIPNYLPQAENVQLDQLVANLQAKSSVYDVIDLDVVWTAEFASNGWIIPLPASQFPLRDFLAPAVKTAMYQGRLYAVPDYSNADLFYYRKDILAKAYVQHPPTTWAQLEDVARKSDIPALPGWDGHGSSTRGGANLAISAYSLHQQTPLHFIQSLTEYDQQATMLKRGSFPPVLKSLYDNPALTRQFRYLPTLYQAIESAQPRPAITNYDH